MVSLIFFVTAGFIQLASSQILSYGLQKNLATPPVLTNLGTNANTANIANIGTNLNTANLQAANLQAANLQASNLQASNIQAVNAANLQANALASNAVASNVAANGIVNPIGLASSNLRNFPNIGAFAIGNRNAQFSYANGPSNIPAFGVQIVADALEIGGNVAVAGRLPIYSTIAVNARLPTEGSATVNYGCVRQSSLKSA